MKTVNDYIQGEFRPCGIELSQSNLLKIEFYSTISGEGEMDAAYTPRIDVAIAKFIPSLLLRAQSMSEGGCSMSWNIQGVKDYYSFLCSEYNLPNKLGSKIQILDIVDYL